MCICVLAYSSAAQNWCAQTPPPGLWGGRFMCVCFLWYSESVFKYWCTRLCVFKQEREKEYVFSGAQSQSTCV